MLYKTSSRYALLQVRVEVPAEVTENYCFLGCVIMQCEDTGLCLLTFYSHPLDSTFITVFTTILLDSNL
jgi:hypothetical protein